MKAKCQPFKKKVKTKTRGAGEMVPLVKHLPFIHDNLSSDARHPQKLGMVVHTCDPNAGRWEQ